MGPLYREPFEDNRAEATPAGSPTRFDPVKGMRRFAVARDTLAVRLTLPLAGHRKNKGRDSRLALCGLLQLSGRGNPQTSGLGWSPPVRIRYTRHKGRAQQRMSWAATGSSYPWLENLPRSGAPKLI